MNEKKARRNRQTMHEYMACGVAKKWWSVGVLTEKLNWFAADINRMSNDDLKTSSSLGK